MFLPKNLINRKPPLLYKQRGFYGLFAVISRIYIFTVLEVRQLSELLSLPNVGKVLAKLFCECGITTADQLREIGAKEAFLRIRSKDPTACIRMLYGIQGAIEGVKDTSLSKSTKDDLKEFYNSGTVK